MGLLSRENLDLSFSGLVPELKKRRLLQQQRLLERRRGRQLL
jgi:hypothetical protein